MIYVTMTFWLLLILFAGIGVYRLLGQFGKPKWVDWALLPGTIVSEMAYIFGCLITGAEVRHAKLIRSESPSSGRGSRGSSSSPQATEATPKLKMVGPTIAALIAIVGCMAAILIVHALLGEPIMEQFIDSDTAGSGESMLAKSIPTTWDGFWTSLRGQVDLVRRMCETWAFSDWLAWRAVLFIYVALCLSIRLAPVSRPVRPTLAAAIVVSVLIALAGMLSNRFKTLVTDLWPLLTYVWASLLLMLLLVLLLRGIVSLVKVLAGKRA